MKPRTLLGTAVLAAALAVAPSCKTPLVDGPASLKTRQHHAQKPHPCASYVIEGGIPTSCHILFQIHERPLLQKASNEAVRSQILLYRVVSDLIKNHGVGVVLLEGVNISEDVRGELQSRCDKKCSDAIQNAIRNCISNMLYDNGIQGRFPSSFSRRGAENFCLAEVLLHAYHFMDISKVLLILRNQPVLFTGFERNRKKRSQDMKKQRLLIKLRESTSPLFGPAFYEALGMLTDSYHEKWIKTRLKHVNKDAIREAVSYSSKNTALIIGLGHKELIEEVIMAIPFDERPTFYFIMPECQDVRAYSISPRIIELASEGGSKNR